MEVQRCEPTACLRETVLQPHVGSYIATSLLSGDFASDSRLSGDPPLRCTLGWSGRREPTGCARTSCLPWAFRHAVGVDYTLSSRCSKICFVAGSGSTLRISCRNCCGGVPLNFWIT